MFHMGNDVIHKYNVALSVIATIHGTTSLYRMESATTKSSYPPIFMMLPTIKFSEKSGNTLKSLFQLRKTRI